MTSFSQRKMLAIIPSQKEIVDKKPFWEVRFMSTSEAREFGAAKHPGQSGQLGQLRFLVQSISYKKLHIYIVFSLQSNEGKYLLFKSRTVF